MKFSLGLASVFFTLAACASSEAETNDAASADDELNGRKRIACSSPRLTQEGYRGAGSFVGDDGQVYVTAKVCIQDDDNCQWAQCDADESGDFNNGGARGDWYGFWDNGTPMRGECAVKIALERCSSPAPPPPPVNGVQCKTAAHGRVNAGTCFQEPNWKWYQCDATGTTIGAAGPNAPGCTQTLWFAQ